MHGTDLSTDPRKQSKSVHGLARLPRNLNLNRVLGLRGVHCTLRVAFGSLIGEEGRVSLVAEFSVFDLCMIGCKLNWTRK